MTGDEQGVSSEREAAQRGSAGRKRGRGRGRHKPDRAGFRTAEGRQTLGHRPPWWGRLEARITISLVAIGILCVGASGYLVALTVAYYDRIGEQQVALEREVIELAEPYYAELAAAQRDSFLARTELLPHEIEDIDEARLEGFLSDWIAAHPAVIEVVVARPDAEPVVVTGERDWGARDTMRVPVVWPLDDRERGTVRVTWAADPAISSRHQRLGELARDLGTVQIRGAAGTEETVERNDVQRAVVIAIGLASSLVLLVAVLAGLVIARRTTRKVSDLSRAMREVASGELSARAPRLGGDELGLLAAAFNTMLDELEDTRRRIAYLQRIGAWQEMARRIAHEIKNPLTPIQLAAQQLREKDPGTDPKFSKLLRDSVEIIEDEVDSLRRMVTSFSEFAKVPDVALEVVGMARVLGEFERAYGHLSQGDELLEVLDLPDPGPGGATLEVLGDRQLLKQILVNLVENAALSAREAAVGEVRIQVSAGVSPGRETAFIAVDDNGPGIEVSRRELVFEPYETTRDQGTGLGLAIVKKIVLDHGGEIHVEDSAALGGARFVVRIPLAPPEE